jgi:hypothetical protein
MGCQHSSVLPTPSWAPYESQYSSTKDYYGAGCLWVSNTHFLAAIHTRQSRSHKPKKISGFGGKTHEGEAWWNTAFRETVEEIFDVKTVPAELLAKLRKVLVPRAILHQTSPSYLTLVFSMDDMKRFLFQCKKYLKTSPLYRQFPTSAYEVVFDRTYATEKSEISHIVFWPRYFAGSHFRFSSDLLNDLGQYNHNYVHMRQNIIGN